MVTNPRAEWFLIGESIMWTKVTRFWTTRGRPPNTDDGGGGAAVLDPEQTWRDCRALALPRLAVIRGQISALAQAVEPHRRRFQLAGLGVQCQWLASHARMAGHPAMAQVASGLWTLSRELDAQPERLKPGVVRNAAEAVDLLTALADTSPEQAGQAEGARILVLDPDSKFRMRIVGSLEGLGLTGAGVASAQVALTVVAGHNVDIVVLRAANGDGSAAKTCQSIRRMSVPAEIAILVLSAVMDRERCDELVGSGASEVIDETCSGSELALKILALFFLARNRGRELP
jgi:CheY-like chemotaxis protein